MSEELARAQRELDERKLRQNAVTAADAVVITVVGGFCRFVIKWVAIFTVFALVCSAASEKYGQHGADTAFQIMIGIGIAHYIFRRIFKSSRT